MVEREVVFAKIATVDRCLWRIDEARGPAVACGPYFGDPGVRRLPPSKSADGQARPR